MFEYPVPPEETEGKRYRWDKKKDEEPEEMEMVETDVFFEKDLNRIN